MYWILQSYLWSIQNLWPLILFIFITEYDESWMSSLKLLLVPCLTSQLELYLSPAEWAAILCGVGGAGDLEELNVIMRLTDVSSVYCIAGTPIILYNLTMIDSFCLAMSHNALISRHLNLISI